MLAMLNPLDSGRRALAQRCFSRAQLRIIVSYDGADDSPAPRGQCLPQPEELLPILAVFAVDSAIPAATSPRASGPDGGRSARASWQCRMKPGSLERERTSREGTQSIGRACNGVRL